MQEGQPQAVKKEKARGFTMFLMAVGALPIVISLFILGLVLQVNVFTIFLMTYVLYLLMPCIWAGVRRRKDG